MFQDCGSASYSRGLIGRHHHTPCAGLHALEDDAADPDVTPLFLGPGFGAGHHDVGTEPIDRDGCFSLLRQRGQRLLRTQQVRITVRERYVHLRRQYRRPRRIVGHSCQPHRPSQPCTQPGVRLAVRDLSIDGVGPDHCRHACRAGGGNRHDEILVSVGRKRHAAVFADRNPEGRQSRLGPLSHEFPVLPHDQPPPIKTEAAAFSHGLRQ